MFPGWCLTYTALSVQHNGSLHARECSEWVGCSLGVSGPAFCCLTEHLFMATRGSGAMPPLVFLLGIRVTRYSSRFDCCSQSNTSAGRVPEHSCSKASHAVHRLWPLQTMIPLTMGSSELRAQPGFDSLSGHGLALDMLVNTFCPGSR